MNKRELKTALDGALERSVGAAGGTPGVVAMVTDRHANLYEAAFGRRELGQDAPMTTDTVMAIFSTTKAVTGVTLMQLVEEGRVKLSDPARAYVPEIAQIQVLDGWDHDGQPRLRAPARDITLEHLMLHTAGFGYEFISHDDLKLRTALDIPSVVTSSFASIRSVLLADPGERWGYGVNMDWAGKVVEAVRGQRLGAVMRERVFTPLDMKDTGFTLTPSMRQRRATIHNRAADGRLSAAPDLLLPQPPEMDMGGHGLYGTVGDYMKFIRMMLNDGIGPHGRALRAPTVDLMGRNGLGRLKVGGWVSSIPTVANSGEFLPGQSKSWGYSFMINDEVAPTGRPAGALMWAGLANLYFWIDRSNGIGGYWASQMLPFQDVASYAGYLDFETSVYQQLRR